MVDIDISLYIYADFNLPYTAQYIFSHHTSIILCFSHRYLSAAVPEPIPVCPRIYQIPSDAVDSQDTDSRNAPICLLHELSTLAVTFLIQYLFHTPPFAISFNG